MDLDGDGILDIISGSWPGEIFFFKGGPDHTFADPVKLRDKAGKLINVTGGKRIHDNIISVAGDATWEKKDGKNFIVYDGEWIECPPDKETYTTGTASAVFAFDWDGDGLLDLIVGEIGGTVHWIRNEGTKTNFVFGIRKN